MPFDLKDVGATYQLTMTIILRKCLDMVECYVDDLVVKSHKKIDHMKHLGIVFDRLSQHQ